MNGQAPSGITVDPSTGVYALAASGAIIAERTGPATIPLTLLVPSQSVRILRVELPLATHARRLAALPFAIEDQIAEPLEAVHLALGAEVAPKTYLVGVVRHSLMEGWLAAADQAGLGDAALVPDALMLPVPDGESWAISLNAGQVRVRQSDATGFAVPANLFAMAWERASEPSLINYGASVIEGFPQTQRDLVHADTLEALPLNLRQGKYSAASGASGKWGRRIALAIGAGLAAHLAIAVADLLALQGIARDREQEVRATVARMAPGLQLGEDVAAQIVPMLPVAGGDIGPFLPKLVQVNRALAAMGGNVKARTMRFEGGQLILEIDGEGASADQIRSALNKSAVQGRVTTDVPGVIRVEVAA